jgi:hypothetical protein
MNDQEKEKDDSMKDLINSLPPQIRNKVIEGFIKETMGIDLNLETLKDIKDSKGNLVGSIGIASKNSNVDASTIGDKVSMISQKDDRKKQDREQMMKFRDRRIEDLKKVLGKEVTEQLLKEEEARLAKLVEDLNVIKRTLQIFEDDFKKNNRRVEDLVQFVNSDRHILYNCKNANAHVIRVFSEEVNELYHQLAEVSDTMSLARIVIPMMRIEIAYENNLKSNNKWEDEKI